MIDKREETEEETALREAEAREDANLSRIKNGPLRRATKTALDETRDWVAEHIVSPRCFEWHFVVPDVTVGNHTLALYRGAYATGRVYTPTDATHSVLQAAHDAYTMGLRNGISRGREDKRREMAKVMAKVLHPGVEMRLSAQHTVGLVPGVVNLTGRGRNANRIPG